MAVAGVFSTVLIVVFVFYVGSILIPFLRRPQRSPGDPQDYQWHLLVPCRDEAAVVEVTISRARERFPSAHLWLIDDDSDDATAAIAQAAQSRDDFVHLVQRRRPDARTGKGHALNAGYDALVGWLPSETIRSRVIVCVLDADGEMAENAFAAVAGPSVFGNPRVGAAQITVWMKNRNDKRPLPRKGHLRNLAARALIRMQDLEFRTVIAAMQSLRERTGTVGLGGNGQFTRLSVLDEIKGLYGEPWHGSLLEDYELGVHVLLIGYENRHVHETYVEQEALTSWSRFATQRTRWSQGNIQCARYIKDIVRSPYLSNAGVVESSYYLLVPFIQVLGFITWITLLVSTAVALASGYSSPWNGAAWIPVVLFAVFGIGPFIVWGPIYTSQCETGKGWWKGILYGLAMWMWVTYTYITITRAFSRVLLRRNGWAKTRRNAEAIHADDLIATEF